jgi:hypothetical protein
MSPMESTNSSVDPPQTLQEWRNQKNQPKGVFPRLMWTPLEAFFIDQGYKLWQPNQSMALHLKPPNDEPRRQDQYTHRTLYNEIEPIRAPHFDMPVGLINFALSALDTEYIVEEFHSLPRSHYRQSGCLNTPYGYWWGSWGSTWHGIISPCY